MANDPNTPQGPLDPGIANVFERMAQALDMANERAASSEKTLEAMAKHAGAVAEEAGRASMKLKDMFKLSDSIEDNYKRIVEYGKKRSAQSIKEFSEAKKARHELEQIADLYESALKSAKDNTKESRAMSSNLGQIRKLMKELPKDGALLENQLQGVADVFDKASRNAKDLVKSMSNLSRTGAAMKGGLGIMSAMGIGRGLNAKVERRFEQVEAVKNAIKESKELRFAATTKHMLEKRAKGIEEIRGMKAKGGLWADPDSGDVMDLMDEAGGLTKGGRDVLARKMGFKPGSKKYMDFIAGEEAGGAAAGGQVGAAYSAAMGEGGGAIAGAMEGLENGLTELAALAPEIIIPLEALAGVIELLVKVFDAYVKQNQEIEKNIGKGGLFTQPGVGAGEAFARARYALTPNVGRGVPLGVSFERNMAIAGAMANAGFNPAGSFGGSEAANQGPGSFGEFMKGGLGEVQRIVMGAGRVGGLTDQEGVEQVMKLLSEYRETIASSEEFMANLNKDTQAAGISTTKYLKIIDDVSSHFDKMGKSLDQVTGVMRELSRYGAISSESLKDMMEFLSAGQQQTTTGNMATAAFTQAMMPKDLLDSVRTAQKETLSNYVDEYNSEAKKNGMKPMNIADMQNAIGKGDFAGAQGMANAMRGDLTKISDPTVKQTMMDALTKVQDQINRVSGVMSPDFLKRASSQGLYGENQADVMAALFGNLRTSANLSGLSFSDLMGGKGGAASQIMVQQLAEMLGVKGSPAKAFGILRDVGQNRINDLTSDSPANRKRNNRELFNEIYKGSKTKEGIAAYLTSKGIGKELFEGAKTSDDILDMVASSDEGLKKLQALYGENLDLIAGSAKTQDKIVHEAGKGNKMTAEGLADQLSQARGIAMRTQTVEDFLKNILEPLILRLVSALEFIATAVSKLTGGNYADVQKKATEDMAAVAPAIDKLSSHLEEQVKSLKTMTDGPAKDAMAAQIKAGNDTVAQLATIQSRGTFGSASQESLVMDAIKKINAGQIPSISGSGVTVNNYYSSNSTQDAAQPANVGTSSDKAPNIKIQPAQRRPMDDR
jgi:hypothetical protein